MKTAPAPSVGVVINSEDTGCYRRERFKFMAFIYGAAFAVYVVCSLLSNALAGGWYLS